MAEIDEIIRLPDGETFTQADAARDQEKRGTAGLMLMLCGHLARITTGTNLEIVAQSSDKYGEMRFVLRADNSDGDGKDDVIVLKRADNVLSLVMDAQRLPHYVSYAVLGLAMNFGIPVSKPQTDDDTKSSAKTEGSAT